MRDRELKTPGQSRHGRYACRDRTGNLLYTTVFCAGNPFLQAAPNQKKNEKNPLIKSEDFSFLFFQPSTDIPDIPDRFPCGSQSP